MTPANLVVLELYAPPVSNLPQTVGQTTYGKHVVVPPDAIYIDLLVQNDDIVLEYGLHEPLLLTDRDCIAQDIKHLIRESGLFIEMVGLRDGPLLNHKMQQLEIMIEDDVRLVPGTIDITRPELELFLITAETADFGLINFTVNL